MMPQAQPRKLVVLQRCYEASGMLTLVAMPFSNLLMSWGAMALAATWLVDQAMQRQAPVGTVDTAQRRANRWGVVLALAFFGWQVVGMAWTEDLNRGWNALRIGLPLVLIPCIWWTGRIDVAGWRKRWPGYFGSAVALACAVVLVRGYSMEGTLRPRDWSPFISHIRFNLMVVWAWAWWTWAWLRGEKTGWPSVVLGALGGWVVWKTASMTGALLLPAVACLLGLGYVRHRWPDRPGFWRGGVAVCLLLFLGLAGWVVWDLKPVYPDPADYPTHSKAGEAYVHRWKRTMREEGNFVWTCVAENEMAAAWEARTGTKLSGKDGRGQSQRMTLIRYLSSLGLCKDAEGVFALTEEDVQRVASGIPTVAEVRHRGLKRRWNVIRFEFWNYVDGGNPSGHSVIQRLAFWDAARYILERNALWGVGTGDLDRSFQAAYEAIDSKLAPAFRLRAHNQFLTLVLATGPVALGLWLVWLVWTVGGSRPRRMEAWLFVFILALSCLTEDTLETQAGVTFAGFFLALVSDRRAG